MVVLEEFFSKSESWVIPLVDNKESEFLVYETEEKINCFGRAETWIYRVLFDKESHKLVGKTYLRIKY